MFKSLKKLVKNSPFLYKIYKTINKNRGGGTLFIANNGNARVYKDIIGQSNDIKIGANTYIDDAKIRIRGNNNSLVFGKNCIIGPDCSFWLEGDNNSIIIGDNCTFTVKCHLNAQEYGTTIRLNEDCMLSNNIIIRTSDSHPIYDMETGERINCAKSIEIGPHVWIAPNSKIMKGVHIGAGTIIGSDTMVTKDLPENVLAVGHPARVVKTDIKWTREKLF